MKSLITLIFTLFIAGALQAQNLQLTLNGNVAYTNGDPVPDIEVNINTDSLPSGNIYFVTAITDSNGDYSATIDLDDQDTQGQLYATTNCDQTLLYDQGDWSPGSDGYDNHLPTYFGNVLWWDEANSINLPNNGWWWHDLTLIEGDNPGGPGFIGGYVADGANLLAGEIEVREDDPMAGVSIILLNEAEEPVAYTYTDEDGVFAFPGLDWGTYKVVIEHIGYEQKHYWVTLSPDNPSVDSMIFEVGSDSITDAEEVQPPSTVDLFPVPATDYLTVQTGQLQDVQAVEIWNAQGQRLLNLRPNTLESGTLQIDVSAFPAGVYWLRTQIGQQLATQKWIKQ